MSNADNDSRPLSAGLRPLMPSTPGCVAPEPRPLWGPPGSKGTDLGKIALAGLGVVVLAWAGPASADPTAGHDAKVKTQIPPMLCEIGSDDDTPGVGPNVVCQGSFAQAPADEDQALVTASGRFSYRSANIGVGYDHPPFDTLLAGQTDHVQGWTVEAGGDGIRFTHDGTGHGMLIGGDTTVNPF
jgi:hypothetical protein